jgi:muconate cycloisomerase
MSKNHKLIIKKVDAIPVALPLKKPMHMAGVVIANAYNLIVRIETENGLVGWGESASAPTMTGDLLPGMVAAVRDYLAPLLLGQDALQHPLLMQRVHQEIYRNTGAKCAVECALLDVCGKYLEVPVFDLVGGAKRQSFQMMTLLGSGTCDQDLNDALEKQKNGFNFFKIKLGVRPIEEDIDHTINLRKYLGKDTILCADANMGLSDQETITYCAAVASAQLLFLEQPLRSNNPNGMAKVAKKIMLPLCGDESITAIDDLTNLSTIGAIEGANLKIIKLGGITAVTHAALICETLGLSVNLACKVAESSIAAASLLHTGAVLPNLDWGISVTNHYLAEDLVTQPMIATEGKIVLSRAPGLGIEVDEKKVQQFTI